MQNSSHTFLTRFFLIQLALAALLAFPFTAKAQRHQQPHHQPDIDIVQPLPPYHQQPSSQMLRAQVNQHSSMRGQTIIPVKQLIQQQTGHQLMGPEIERIILVASQTGRLQAQAQLLVDGRRVLPPQIISGSSDKVVFPLNRLGQTLGYARNIQIEITGNVFIDEVMVKTSGQIHQPNQITIPLNTQLWSRQSTRLSDLLRNEHLPPQMQITHLSLVVSSRSQGALGVIVRGLGMVENARVSYYTQTLDVNLPLGTDLNEITLNSTGDIELISVTLHLQHQPMDWISF